MKRSKFQMNRISLFVIASETKQSAIRMERQPEFFQFYRYLK